MEESSISLIISVAAFVTALLAFFRGSAKEKQETKAVVTQDAASYTPLQLQAYERLVILTERIALPNLINRVYQPHLTAREMQGLLLENIRQEFEYNTSQQIYVSQKAWDGVRNLRDQNMLIINSIAKTLAPDAKAGDLNRQIIEAMMSEEQGALHSHVASILNEEAKRLL
jgi:hypothetical protein